jgi:hypothetical protein
MDASQLVFWGSHHHNSYSHRVVEVVGPGNWTAPHSEATGRGTSRTAAATTAGTSGTQEALMTPVPTATTAASEMTSEVNTITMTTEVGAAEVAVAEMTGGGTAPEMAGGDDNEALWEFKNRIVNIFHFF